jgi:hypothetical protein
MKSGDGVAQLAERVEEAGGIGAARNQAEDLAARLDQLVPADMGLDAPEKLQAERVFASNPVRSSGEPGSDLRAGR